MIAEKSERFYKKEMTAAQPLPEKDEVFWQDFSKLVQCYQGNLKVASTQLEVLDAELRSSNTHQPIFSLWYLYASAREPRKGRHAGI